MDRLKSLNILFLDDNEEFSKNTTEFLNMYFKQVFQCSSISSATKVINDNKVDVIISAVKLADGNGLDFIKQLRDNDNNIPIAVISAYKHEDLLLKAIPLNLLSYEIKPITYNIFISLLQKISNKLCLKGIVPISNSIKYNSKTKELLTEKENIALTKKESLFIELIIKNPNEIITHEMIQINIWENKHMSDSAIKNLILRLRKKVGKEFISNINGVGYRLLNNH